MGSIDVDPEKRSTTGPAYPLPSPHGDTAVDQLRDISRWLLISPLVMAMIFVSAHLGLLFHYRFAFTSPDADLNAEYAPWSFMLIRSIRPAIIDEIRFDLRGDSKSIFQDPEKVKSSWVSGEPQDENTITPPTPTPSPTAVEDRIRSPTPSESPTSTATAVSTKVSSSTATGTLIASATPTSTSTATPSPTKTPTPTLTPTPSPTAEREFTLLSSYGTYPSSGRINRNRGTISVWLNFAIGQDRSDHMILHTDDSRWVFYIDTFYSSGLDRNILSIAARAGGNKSATSDKGDRTGYPEARLLIDNDGSLNEIGYGEGLHWIGVEAFPEGEWHHLAMTWKGYPDGIVRLYLDGLSLSYLEYDSRYDDGSPLFTMFSFGFKPIPWPDLASLPEYGDVGSGRLASGGIQAADLRLYDTDLSPTEIIQIASLGIVD